MWLEAANTRKAVEVGTSLADQFVRTAPEPVSRKRSKVGEQARQLQSFLAQVDREALPLQLGLFRRAKLASTFKWRLLDNGIEPEIVDELTRMLLLRLAAKPATSVPADTTFVTPVSTPKSSKV
jgi:hypothetical protein